MIRQQGLLDQILGRTRRHNPDWEPQTRAILDIDYASLKRSGGSPEKSPQGFAFWNVSAEELETDFPIDDDECAQISDRDYRTLGRIYPPEEDVELRDRDEFFVTATSPKMIRALADAVDGTAMRVEGIKKEQAKHKRSKVDVRAQSEAVKKFSDKLERIGFKVRASNLQGKMISAKYEGDPKLYRRMSLDDAVTLAAWETGLYRFYYLSKLEVEEDDDELEVSASFKEAAHAIPSSTWRQEKQAALSAVRSGEDMRHRKEHHYA